MLSVAEFMQSLNKNQLSLMITVQRDDFIDHDYPFRCHIHFDNDSVRITNCKVSSKIYNRRKNRNRTRSKTVLGRTTL